MASAGALALTGAAGCEDSGAPEKIEEQALRQPTETESTERMGNEPTGNEAPSPVSYAQAPGAEDGGTKPESHDAAVADEAARGEDGGWDVANEAARACTAPVVTTASNSQSDTLTTLSFTGTTIEWTGTKAGYGVQTMAGSITLGGGVRTTTGTCPEVIAAQVSGQTLSLTCLHNPPYGGGARIQTLSIVFSGTVLHVTGSAGGTTIRRISIGGQGNQLVFDGTFSSGYPANIYLNTMALTLDPECL